MREDVVQLACDPAALGDRRRPRLLLARVLELREQHLGPVLALASLFEEIRDQADQGAQQRGGKDRRGRATRERRRHTERDGRDGTERDRERQGQASDRHPHRGSDSKAGSALRLKRRERDSGGAHRRDHSRLEPEASLDERIPDGRRQRGNKDDECQRDPEPAAPQRGPRVPVECPEDDDRDHGQAERPQRVPLTPQPQRSAGLRPCNACALAAGGCRPPHDARGLFGHGHLW